MLQTIQIRSHVGKDGVLNLHVPFDPGDAEAPVLVTIQKLDDPARDVSAGRLNWREFLHQTYGSCAGLELERATQGQFEQREQLE